MVITSSPDAPFVRRLAAELALFGYRVELQARDGTEADLLELLARSGGNALIAVDQGSQTAEVVVSQNAAGGTARRERERLDPRRRADTNAAVLAERFRARLTELGIAPSASPEDAPSLRRPPPPPPRPAPEPDRRLWLAAALGVSSGGLGAVPEAALELRAFPARFVSTSAFGKLALSPAKVRSDAGSADVRFVSGGVLIDAYPLRIGEFAVKAGLGALLVNASMSGHAADSAGEGREASVLVPAGMFEMGVSLRLASRFSAELGGFVGACSPRVGVHFKGEHIANYGQPFFGGSLGFAIGVF